ncbi:hypothetical protein B566_EDAN009007 [Ephemera danica]|nr:hypothetical protein B566_EDAN009007 [Ephemera danica]
MLPALLLLLRIGLLLVMCRANFAASAVPGAPENITVTFLTPSSVQVSWAVVTDGADKYDVMYKPTDAR